MASKPLNLERMEVLLRELMAEGVEAGGLSINDVNDIEEAMVELGDAAAREYTPRQPARQMERSPAVQNYKPQNSSDCRNGA